VGAGMTRNVDGNRVPIDQWDVMWPQSSGFTYDVDWSILGAGQNAGAGLVMFWVYLTTALAGAFAISFYFSANTIIYYLMRREVDATELDDVYLEQADEDFGDTPPAVPTSAPAAPAAAPAGTGTGTVTVVTPATPTTPPPAT